MTLAPVAVEVWRGERVESRHRVALAIVDASGREVLALGDVDEPVYPRSAIKPIQALLLVESGAADACQVSEAELALACASHGGEPMHVEPVATWLARLGLREADLACGAHPPSFRPAADALVRQGLAPTRMHNNCSGKHTGMLAAARHLGWPTRGYEDTAHPVQQAVLAALRELSGMDDLGPPGIDGCSLPNWPVPLRGLALAFARFAAPDGLPPARAAAIRRITAAMQRYPALVAGTGRCCTAVMQALPDVLVKTGAEGVFTAALPGQGLGIALKAEDGATRAAEVALLAMLDALGAVTDEAGAALEPFARPTLRSHMGAVVGRVAPVPGWPPGLPPQGSA